MRRTSSLAFVVFAVANATCASSAFAAPIRPNAAQNALPRSMHEQHRTHDARKLASYPTPIHHVVVVVMENRTIDNLFQLVPGADVSGTSNLTSEPLIVSGGPGHSHGSFVSEFKGKYTHSELAYVDPTTNYVGKVYYGLAKQWVLADEVFQMNEGPSFPAHQYLIAGQSGGINNIGSPFNIAPLAMSENTGNGVQSGCGNTSTVQEYIDMTSPYPGTESVAGPPCDDYNTVLDTVTAAFGAGSTPAWRYYIAGPGNIWDAPDAVHHLYPAPTNQLITDITGSGFSNDVKNGVLAPLSYVIPCGSWSDHAGVPPATKTAEVGPNFVNFITNTIGNSQYWMNTTILVTWDDWGGWYDHVVPPHIPNAYGNAPNDPYEYGFRVPLLIISPYLHAPGMVDHYGQGGVPLRTQGSILRYIETTFGLPSLGTADEAAVTDDLTEAFDFTRQPLNFTAVTGPSTFPAPKASDCTHAGP
jgi:phospholipase C